MKLSQKTKGVIIAIVFVVMLILPACYGLVRELIANHNDAKKAVPAVQKQP